MATAVEKAIDVAADVAEEVAQESAEVAEVTRSVSPKEVSLIGAGVLFGTFVGSFGTHYFLSKFLRTKFEKIANEEIASMREHYLSRVRALENEREKEKLDEVREEIQERQDANDGEGQTPYHQMYAPDTDVEASHGKNEPVVQNVFVNNGNDPEVTMEEAWDYEEELRQRSPQVPYILHRDEYNNETPEGFEQYTLTYFEGDDVLCRDDDRVIEDQDSVVGLGNLAKFGHGSGDPNIIYIRNHELKVDLEVVHSDGKYATEVHGFQDDELQHSSMRRRSPRRSEYDADR